MNLFMVKNFVRRQTVSRFIPWDHINFERNTSDVLWHWMPLDVSGQLYQLLEEGGIWYRWALRHRSCFKTLFMVSQLFWNVMQLSLESTPRKLAPESRVPLILSTLTQILAVRKTNHMFSWVQDMFHDNYPNQHGFQLYPPGFLLRYLIFTSFTKLAYVN